MLYVANFTRKYNNTKVDGDENKVFFPGKIYTCRINISQHFFTYLYCTSKDVAHYTSTDSEILQTLQ
jgi:hypothetical protein